MDGSVLLSLLKELYIYKLIQIVIYLGVKWQISANSYPPRGFLLYPQKHLRPQTQTFFWIITQSSPTNVC